jgi:hypothetical protein
MVRVAAALLKGRSAAAQTKLAALLDEAQQTGVVQKAIDAKGLEGVNVAAKIAGHKPRVFGPSHTDASSECGARANSLVFRVHPGS